ncbi:S41 family peptidase [Pedobacter sp. P351]|uniref:S41 family peptidase n=1 Tax=Pedobacter superstes TaxID=3133441 RepID=UPI00309EC07D
MNSNYLSRHSLQFFIIGFTFLSVSFTACKKNRGADIEYNVLDSAYLYTRDIYLWAEKLPAPSVFKPRTSPDIYALMERVRGYQPLDKWSFAETKEETKQTLEGSSDDFGFLVKFVPGNNTEIRVTYVYSNSSAGITGVKRTWRVNKINGRVINRSVPADLDYINDVFFGSPKSAQFEFIRPNGTVTVETLQKTSYKLNTVLYSSVYIKGDRKIGYFVFNEFSEATSVLELLNTIGGFENQGVNEIIVDLRYNRGGFVSTQDTLANMLAPKSVGRAQKVMYTYVYNSKYTSWNESYKFYKTGSLDLSRIVFIVSPSSASASELLINNLRPVMSVKLIGDTRTYGKPVGFFPIPVFEYNIFPVSFKTANSNGEADFFAGFPVDKNVADDLVHDFGDENEANLKEALFYLSNNSFSAIATNRISSVNSAEVQYVRSVNADIADHLPSATIENRPSRMPPAIKQLQGNQNCLIKAIYLPN